MCSRDFIKLFGYVLLSLLFYIQTQNFAHADERYEFYDGIRALGMGGASIATVNDETALLSNPAALGKLRNYFITVADPELDIGSQTQAIVDTNLMKFMDPQDVLDATKLKPDKHLHERAQLFPSFVVTNFGLGVFMRYSTDATYDSSVPELDYHYRNDYAVVMGFNFRILDGIIKLGVNARGVNRVESDRIDLDGQTNMKFETVVNSETVAREGFGLGSDAGLIITAPMAMLPSLAVVYRDIGTTTYDVNKGMFFSTTFRPHRTPPTLDGAFAIYPIISNNVRMSITAEMSDIMDRVEPADKEASDEIMRRIHGGMEINLYDTVFFRAGMNQGYWTAGVELSMYNTQLQFASYGEEIGDVVAKGSTATYTREEDRRYVFKFAYRF